MKGKRKIACLLLGGVCCLSGACGEKKKGALVQEVRVQKTQITGVEIDWERGHIEVEQSPDGEVYATGEQADAFRYYVERGVLKIERKEGRARAEKDTLRVELPVGLHLEIDGNGAEVTLGVLDVETLSVETDGGNISAEKITCRQGEFDTDEGCICIGDISADSVEADSESGEINVGFSKPVRAEFSTKKGDVHIFLLAGVGAQLRFESNTGKLQTGLPYEKQRDIYVFSGEQSCSIYAQTKSGNCRVE